MSERDEYIAGHTTREVKAALDEEASQQDESRSLVIHKAVVEYLKARGHNVKEEFFAPSSVDDNVHRTEGGSDEPPS